MIGQRARAELAVPWVWVSLMGGLIATIHR